MKFLNLIFLTLVAGNAIHPSSEDTENSRLDSSIDDTESSEFVKSVDKFNNDNNNKGNEKQNNTEKSSFLKFFNTFLNPTTTKTTEEEAKNFIKYAGAAYCAKEEVENWNCNNCKGYKGVKKANYFSDPVTETAGYLAVDTTNELIVLSYRGSISKVNWVYNLEFELISADLPGEYSEAKIHKGFNKMANALLKDSTDLLKKASKDNGGYRVVFTGHSLGGALATLIADKLIRADVLPWNKVSIITYGQPRVGNPTFAAYLDSKPWTSTRVTSYGDLVAISPGLKFGYMHNQHNMHIDKNNNTLNCSNIFIKPKCTVYPLGLSKEAHFTYWGERMNTKCQSTLQMNL